MTVEERINTTEIPELKGKENLSLPEKLSIISRSGKAKEYGFRGGDEVIIKINNKPITFEICAFNHYLDEDENSCGITFISKEPIGNYQMNPESTNEGGWVTSDLRQVLNSEVYNSIDPAWRKVIRATYVPTFYAGRYFETLDFLFIPSVYEIYGEHISSREGMGNWPNYYKEYKSIHKQEGTPIPYLYSHRDKGYWHWTRSACLAISTGFWHVAGNGDLNHFDASGSHGVALCFSI